MKCKKHCTYFLSLQQKTEMKIFVFQNMEQNAGERNAGVRANPPQIKEVQFFS